MTHLLVMYARLNEYSMNFLNWMNVNCYFSPPMRNGWMNANCCSSPPMMKDCLNYHLNERWLIDQ
jgi:hypothetical protein